MLDLRELYQEVILDHNKRPRNFRVLDDANCTAQGFNPLCGDRLSLFVRIEGETIANVGFQGVGCAISKASASLMTDLVKGKTVAEAKDLFRRFHEMVTSGLDMPVDESLGKLIVLAGVREFPTRVKCASLAWHTLKAAVDKQPEVVSTE